MILFGIMFAMCTMLLKTESSRTFKELGFNFKNNKVHKYLKEQAPELRKICQGTRKSYVWELPIDNGKTLKFAEVVRKKTLPFISPVHKFLPKFNSIPQVTWELIRINGKINFNPFEIPTLTISFQIRKDKKEIYLKNLYPTFPKVSGVDILQFLMSLSYVCGFTLSLKDESDISVSYRLLHGTGYYESLIKGYGIKTTNQNQIIFKNDFYKCANFELQHLDFIRPIGRIHETLNSCWEKGISVPDCPIHFLWLSNAIHYALMPKCGLNFKWKEFFTQPELEFQIIPRDITRIFNKIPPKSKPVLYPIVKNCTPKVKDFENVEKDIFSLKFFKDVFDFCFPDSKFTALHLFEILRGCVTETLNFLWKNECNPNKNSSKV